MLVTNYPEHQEAAIAVGAILVSASSNFKSPRRGRNLPSFLKSREHLNANTAGFHRCNQG